MYVMCTEGSREPMNRYGPSLQYSFSYVMGRFIAFLGGEYHYPPKKNNPKKKNKNESPIQKFSFFFELVPFFTGLGSRAFAACHPHGNQPYTILKISWNSKPDPIMAVPPFNFF